ncbi:unnamed protein product [Mytilus coruscus]|uniref:Ig-like domain-containing protein n=1 Tax=Mytilus coruscus TaxID=42192 RepID=A0A6J8EKC9_MYTCO|nr:unnamed protein product [Mytilus coruscus]
MLLAKIPDLQAYTKGREVLLVFEKDVGPAIALACNYDDTIHIGKTAEIIRSQIKEHKTNFSGSFSAEDTQSSVPTSLLELVCMIEHGPDIESQLENSVHLCAGFPLKCPEPAQWSLRANGHCADPSKYFCLKNDLINGYSENCTTSDFQQPGRKSVLRGGIDAVLCSLERYQPFSIRFYTNVSTNCIFMKSFCNEEGQVVYDHGNRITDITCRCDYRRDFDFLVKPNNPCFCKPSQEDCSCYFKTCSNTSHVLSKGIPVEGDLKSWKIRQWKKIFLFQYHHIFLNRKLNWRINIGLSLSLILKSIIYREGLKQYTYVKQTVDGDFSPEGIRTITFETPGEYDHGTFKCVFKNVVGTVESEPVLLYGKLYEVPPQILEQKTIASESGGINIGLKCIVKSYLPLTSVIYREGLKQYTDIKQTVEDFSPGGIRTITFETPGEYDHGTFKCVFKNEVGTVESEPVLLYGKLYEVPPKILEQKNIPSDSGGITIGLICIVRSYLPLKSEIYRTDLGENTDIKQTVDEDFSSHGIRTITFETPGEYDRGTFKCVFKNEVGTVESEPVLLYGKLYEGSNWARKSFLHPMIWETISLCICLIAIIEDEDEPERSSIPIPNTSRGTTKKCFQEKKIKGDGG